MTVPRLKKRRPPPWTKPALHFSLCFVLGLFTGFSHPSTPSLHLTLTSPDPIPPVHALPPPLPPRPTSPPLTSPRLLIFITTTRSTNPLQPPLLQRLSRTLRLVPPPLLWIIVEAHDKAPATSDVLRRTGILYRHLTYRDQFEDKEEEEEHHQRNVALSHVEHHRLEGIVCFAGAENMYDLSLFDKIRGVDVFGVWPVAIVTTGGKPEITVEGPVCNSSKVVGWHSIMGEMIGRREVSIWGFGFNSSILWDPERWGRPTSFPDTSQDSMKYVHETILEDKTKVKAFPSSCSEIMLWRLQIQTENTIRSQR